MTKQTTLHGIKYLFVGISLGAAVTTLFYAHLIRLQSNDLHECVMNWQDTATELGESTYSLKMTTAALEQTTDSLNKCNDQLIGATQVHD